MISDSAILRKIGQQPKQSAGLKQLLRELGVRGEDRRAFAAQLDQLVRRGELVAHEGDRYAIPKKAADKNLVSGRLTMHRDGYGFVIPDSEELRQRLNGDIYIGPQNTDNAMHGDRVLVELRRERGDGRAEGQIVKVIGRAHATVVGTFHYGARSGVLGRPGVGLTGWNYVTPMDEKITLDIVILRGAEIPSGGVILSEHAGLPRGEAAHHGARVEGPKSRAKRISVDRVLGAEAKRTEVAEDLENVVVDVELTEWPTPTQNPRGRVVEILGYEDDFGVDVEIVIRKYHLPHRFPTAVLAEAQAFDNIIPARELRGRRDYRTLPVVTIDGETARDFDDAVFVRRLHNGNFQLQVHIADVAQYVREASALDAEARLRGNSVYFPDRAVPMLPIELSTDLCSLRPHLDRLVLSCVMEIDSKGDIVGYEISPGVIRSAERMTYTDVNAILEGDAKLHQRYHALVDVFELMRELAMILNRKRVRRGSIDFDLPEPVIEFDEFGLMKTITRSERNFAHRLIEEFMLAANESVASYLENKGVESLYRIHEKPDPKRVYEFENIAVAFGYSLGVGALPVKRFSYTDQRRPGRGPGRTRSGQQRHEMEIPQDLPITPRMYQKLTEKIAGKPEERILSYLMLRSLKQAKYSEENVGHFALAAPTYTHFTSPIRRYPDLIVHRILKQVLRDSAEKHDGPVPLGVGVLSEKRGAWADGSRQSPVASRQEKQESPWGKGSPKRAGHRERTRDTGEDALATHEGPIPPEVLHEIAMESSESERRADDAERELMEWKKIKFMQDRVGEDFEGLITSVTRFGFFVELMDMFIEGLVPLSTLTGDQYTYHDSTKQIVGQRTKKKYSLGDKVRVILDRIDNVQRKLQFAVVEEMPSRAQRRPKG
ncbi:MAG: RNB domain-containing ribonuclease [Acidobacteriia bacterium]|nr:RNB domain-containing ribonuclease [Terriglobia bacterium]